MATRIGVRVASLAHRLRQAGQLLNEAAAELERLEIDRDSAMRDKLTIMKAIHETAAVYAEDKTGREVIDYIYRVLANPKGTTND